MIERGGQYDSDYFLHGKETGKSLYEDYRWMPDLTRPMVCSIISYLGISPNDTILDFGCARGYMVRAFREMGYDAWGVDISEWAIANCDPSVREFILAPGWTPRFTDNFGWIIAKDVLEHVPSVAAAVADLMRAASIGVFAVVPLSACDGCPYVVEDYDKDVTHIHRMTLSSWVRLFIQSGWSVEASYRVRGVKDNYAKYLVGNGFITARRQK